ncbi:MAG: ABC transporter permease [Gemmatimonadota bacterium]|nr:ABC transporter permease [Gemmatimonadota bacterium]MDH3427606.1 ABC transporter permease [Gemmatimonadota bacterium]
MTSPSSSVRAIGRKGIHVTRQFGSAGVMACATASALRRPNEWRREAFVQAKAIGIDSLPLVLFVGALSGSILAQQAGYQFTDLPMWIVGQAVVAGMLTELAPLLSAIIMAGRVGAGIGAELGTMKVTDQIDALRTLGRDPIIELVVPRVVAGAIVMVPIVIFANIIGVLSGWFTSIALLPMTTAEYVRGVQSYNYEPAVIFTLIKAVCFGITITFTGCFVGFHAEGGAAGVGRTARNTVVAIIVALMVLDVVLAPIYKAVS